MSDPQIIAEMIRTLVADQGSEKSITPAQVAQAIVPGDADWQRLLPIIRAQAAILARAGEIDILRKGKPVDPNNPIKGVIRLRHRLPA